MERILNENERLRKAEEIYFKRNNKNINLALEKEEVKKENKNFFKFAFYVIFFVNLILTFTAIQEKDYIFNAKFLEKCNEVNINVSNEVNKVINKYIKKSENSLVETNNCINEVNSVENTDTKLENTTNSVDSNEQANASDLVMENDIQNLKAYSFINPLPSGILSSGFGERESKYQNVSGYHKGIDIAEKKGTNIKCAMEGIVTLVSSKGDYGNHVKIRCNNVTTLYAHCSKVYVKEGQIIAQGQVIATVGSTGNSTGNHLHFEIRVEDRFVDPAKIINFES